MRLRHIYYGVVKVKIFWRLRRLLAWLPVLWNDAEWDHAFLFRIMEFKLRRMARYHRRYGNLARSERTVQQLTEAAALCSRMANEIYFANLSTIAAEDAAYQRDLDRLLFLFKKYVREWWD